GWRRLGEKPVEGGGGISAKPEAESEIVGVVEPSLGHRDGTEGAHGGGGVAVRPLENETHFVSLKKIAAAGTSQGQRARAGGGGESKDEGAGEISEVRRIGPGLGP